VPGNQERRDAAQQALQQRMEHRAKQARRRRRALIGAGIAVVVLALAGTGGGLYAHHRSAVAAAHAAAVRAHTCRYRADKQDPAPKGRKVGLPPNPYPTPKHGSVEATLHTSAGTIPIRMNRARAPCTVQSEVHLIKKNFYADTPCHRETDTKALKVLQCGDPTGSGRGGPGYTIPDEKPKHLKPAPKKYQSQVPAAAHVQLETYPRGTVAMANTGSPHSGGSQFFLVDGDSYLPADYTVFGRIEPSGLHTLAKIREAGIEKSKDPKSGQTVSKPKKRVTIKKVTLAKSHAG
jgi:peptidyl-prolyl cis-trans isomerase B (cyclophilin B)